MTPEAFRTLALALPDAAEGAHMGHADFRAGGRIFATLGHPDAAHAMIKLTPDEQALRLETAAATFRPAAGAWGRQGSTLVILADAETAAVGGALACAHAAASAKPPPRPRKR